MNPFPLVPQARQINWPTFMHSLRQKGLLDKPQVVRWLAYQRGYWDMHFFARYFFAQHCKAAFSSMHLDFCRSESDPTRRGQREAIAAPRGNAKTTFKLLIKAIHAIVYGYESFILVLAHSAPEAEEKVRSILDELESNPRLIQVYGALAPVRGKNQGVARWGKKKFVTQNGVMVLAKSRGQQIRGLKHVANRPSLIICDDVESPDGVLSPEQRLKTRDWFYKDLVKCGQVDGSTNITVIGTCVHQESLLSELLRSPGFQASRYQSIISYAQRQDLWEEWKQIYTNLSNAKRHQEAEAFYQANREAMQEGTQVLWPEGEPYEYLMRLKVDEGIASFQSEKQNDPFDPERQLFDMSQIRRFRVVYHEGQWNALEWLDGSGKSVNRAFIKEIVAFHDPALGKKAGQVSEPDFAAIVVVAKDQDGYLYCLDAYIEKDPPSKQIQRAFKMFETWGFNKLYLEENHFQELLKIYYQDGNTKRDKQMPVRGIHQHENKYKRISTLEPEISNGYLLFAENINPRLIEQMTLFPTSYDDGPDALHGAVEQLKNRFDPIRNAPPTARTFTPPLFNHPYSGWY